MPIGTMLSQIPMSIWPPMVSRWTGVLTPRALIPHKTPTSSGGANVRMLFDFLDRTAQIDGSVAECGVWRGRTFIAMALYLKQKGSSKTLWGFDSFQGFDEPAPNDFKNASLALVEQKAEIFRLSNVRTVPGYFRESFAAVESCRFSFVHIDCDVYDSYKECLDFFYPRMNPNGVLLFDEYDDPEWPGANRAVDEFCDGHGIRLHSVVKDNYRKSFIMAPPA